MERGFLSRWRDKIFSMWRKVVRGERKVCGEKSTGRERIFSTGGNLPLSL